MRFIVLTLLLSACSVVGGWTPSNVAGEDTDVVANDTDALTDTETDVAEDTDSVPADTVEVEDTDVVEETDDSEPVDSADTEDTEEVSDPDPLDEDEDGFRAGLGRGEDCDDDNDAVHPDAAEVAGNGTDENCDGRDCPGGEDLCVLDQNHDGRPDTIAWADAAWDDDQWTGDRATVLENGTGTGCRLTGRELSSNGLSYILDFRGLSDCTTALTLKTDSGREWWQNAGFCQRRYRPTDTDSWCYSPAPGDYMVGIEWRNGVLSPFDP